jgi:hypothetical protein
VKKNKTFQLITVLILLNVALYGYLYLYGPNEPAKLKASADNSPKVDYTTSTFEKNYSSDSVKAIVKQFEEPAKRTPVTGGLTGDWIVFNLQDNNIFSWSLLPDGKCQIGAFNNPNVATQSGCRYQYNESSNRLDLRLSAEGKSMTVSYQYQDNGDAWSGLTNITGDDPLLLKRYEKPGDVELTGRWSGFDENSKLDVDFYGGDTVRFLDEEGREVVQDYVLSKVGDLTRVQFSYEPNRVLFVIPVTKKNVMIIDRAGDFVMDLYKL